jgi:hypothetical protein
MGMPKSILLALLDFVGIDLINTPETVTPRHFHAWVVRPVSGLVRNDLRLPKLLVQWRVANLQSLTVAGAAQALLYDKNPKTHLFPSFT